MEEVKACPMCGTNPSIIQNHGLTRISCSRCGTSSAPKEEQLTALAGWNRRAESAAIAEATLVEQLGLRDHFAANAPDEIPEWFAYKRMKRELPAPPHWKEIEDERDQKACYDWLLDPCYDLPEHLRWYQEEMGAYNEARQKLAEQNEADRYFQWRWFYADQMLAARQQKGGAA